MTTRETEYYSEVCLAVPLFKLFIVLITITLLVTISKLLEQNALSLSFTKTKKSPRLRYSNRTKYVALCTYLPNVSVKITLLYEDIVR